MHNHCLNHRHLIKTDCVKLDVCGLKTPLKENFIEEGAVADFGGLQADQLE
jgi:hypothetical protein